MLTYKRSGSSRFVTLLFTLAGSVLAQSGLPSTTADFVWGQGGNPSTNTSNKGGSPDRTNLSAPASVAIDSDGGVYIADLNNNRVLHYPKGSSDADFVYGQNGSFNTNTANKGGVSETSLKGPMAVALDGAGGLFISDNGNNRVLHYAKGSTNADFVYGQNGSFTSNLVNQPGIFGGVKDVTLSSPGGLAVDKDGSLYVADQNDNRIVHYPKGTNIADNVWGQGGSFTDNTVNKGGLSAFSLSSPAAVAVDTVNGGIYVADRNNNRVLHFPTGSTLADRVYGQGINNFTSNTANKGGTSAFSLSAPSDVVLDGAGGIYVADSSNNRVVHYPQGSMTADVIYGQSNDPATNTANKGGDIGFNGLNKPSATTVDSAGNLYIVDTGNNRVLRYEASLPSITTISTTPTSPVAGQQFSFTISGSNFNPATAIVNFTGPNCAPCVATLGSSNTATQLTGTITLQSAGNYAVTVQNGATGPLTGSLSVTVTSAQNAVTISSITTIPSAPVTGQSFSFTITGTNFNPLNAIVNFTGINCTPCTAVPGSNNTATQLTGTITLQAAGVYNVTVQNGATGLSSANFPLTVFTPQTAGISISSITTVPNPPVAGQQFSFTLAGSSFNPATAIVNFTGPNCTPCAAVPGSNNTATQLTGTITLQSAGNYNVTVQNGAAGPQSGPVSLTVAAAGVQTSSTRALPQVAFGQGWYTALYFNNSNTAPVSVTVKLFNADGTPLNIPGMASNMTNVALAANGTAALEFPNVGNTLQQGWAQLTLQDGVSSYAVFRSSVSGQQDQEAAVPVSSVTSATGLLIFDNTGPLSTGAAFVNPTTVTETITITAADASGQTIGTSSVTLPPNGRASMVIHTLPGLGSMAGKRGSLTFTAPGGAVAVLGLRFNSSNLGLAISSMPATQK